MISYKDKEKIKRYTQNIVANEDADYIIHFISLTDEDRNEERDSNRLRAMVIH